MRDFHVFLRICLEKSFPFKMLSTVLLSQRSYLALLLAEQPVHQRLNISGPLVQGNEFLNSSRAPQVESKLSHDVLNSTQVPFLSANSRTLGTFFSPRIWSVNIEVPNNSVDMDSRELSACYPWRIFDSLSTSLSTQYLWIIMTDFRLCSICESCSQANLYHYALQ